LIAFAALGATLGFAGAAQPGPFQTFVISQTLRNGWKRTLVAAFAPLLSDGPIIALVLLLLTQMPPALQRVLHLASALFLGYLAYDAMVKWRRVRKGTAIPPDPGGTTLLKAVLMNFISPGPYVYWSLVAGPTFLSGWRETPSKGIAFLVGFYGTLVATFVAVILVFGTARRFGPGVTRVLLGLSAAALAGFCLYQLWLGLGPGPVGGA
jgi:threonine/homoserine/homoserine lactone efflux protein